MKRKSRTFTRYLALMLLLVTAQSHAQIQFGAPTDLPINAGGLKLAAGDLDGDLDMDLVVLTEGQVEIYLNQGGRQGGSPGAFMPNATLPITLNEGRDVALADLDGDTWIDLVVVEPDQVRVLLNDAIGTGMVTFTAQTAIAGSELTTAAAGDLNGDGMPDLVLGAAGPDQVLRGDGGGGFAPLQTLPNSGTSRALALADMDRDGDLDIVAGGDALVLWINQGNLQEGSRGGFLAGAPVAGGTGITALAVADISGSVSPDVVVSNSQGVILLINALDSFFPLALERSFDTLWPSTVSAIVAADLDLDQDQDLLLSTGMANAVLVNQGGIQLGSRGRFVDAGQSPGTDQSRAVLTADLNHNGAQDAVFAYAGQAAAVLTNLTPPDDPVNPVGWQRQMVLTRGRVGQHPDVAVDAAGQTHIAHLETRYAPDASVMLLRPPLPEHALRYSRFDGVAWQHVRLMPQFRAPNSDSDRPSIAVDSLDRPHIALATPDEVLYWTFDGTSWQRELVADRPGAGNVVVRTDPLNRPEVAFIDDGSLYVAQRTGIGWNTAFLSPAQSSKVRLEIDSDFRARVVFKNSNNALTYGFREGSFWQYETIVTATSGDFDAALGVGEALLVAYQEGGNLYQATVTGGQIQTELVSSNGSGSVSIAVGADGIARYAVVDQNRNLAYGERTGPALVFSTVDQVGGVSNQNPAGLAVGPDHVPILAYQARNGSDLATATFEPRWRLQEVAAGEGPSPAIALHRQVDPVLARRVDAANQYATLNRRAGNWVAEALGNGSAPAAVAVTAAPDGEQHAIFFDASTAQLSIANGSRDGPWQVQSLESTAEIGPGIELLQNSFAGSGSLRAVYWDAGNAHIRLARFLASNPAAASFSSHTGTAAGVAPADTPLQAAISDADEVFVTYMDRPRGELRLARNNAMDLWTDTLIHAAVPDTALVHDVAFDRAAQVLAVAFHDPGLRSIFYGTRAPGGGWSFQPVARGIDQLSQISLALAANQFRKPQIAYRDTGRNQIRVISLDPFRNDEAVTSEAGTAGEIALAVGRRAHLAATEAGGGLRYIARSATLDLPRNAVLDDLGPLSTDDPIQACLGFLVAVVQGGVAKQLEIPAAAGAEGDSLSDREALQGAYPAWNERAGTRRYINLLLTHGSEMNAIAVADPRLRGDVVDLVQDMLPGLEAITQGRGDEVGISAELMAEALSMWQRLAARGSPELREVIELELQRYNNLDNFVGRSWAGALDHAHDRTLLSDGFE